MKNFKLVKSLVSALVIVLIVLLNSSVSVDAAGSNLVVRNQDAYNVDFTSMSLADYCMFFVQDINLKYGVGHGCLGNGRSSDILNYSSLQEVAINELNGGDNGLDCSSFVYLVGKFFGSSCDATSTTDWSRMQAGTNLKESRINAKNSGFDGVEAGDVIITMSRRSGGHALIVVGEVNGEMSMVHIGSSYTCDNLGCPSPGASCTCCSIVPGSGVNTCGSCNAAVSGTSGQYKRFIRVESVNRFFSDLSTYSSVYIYKPIYGRELGSGYTGTSYGSGASSSTLINWITKTGTLLEEAAIPGMPGQFIFDGEPVVITGRDGLTMNDVSALTTIGSGINYGKLSIESVIGTITVGLGYLLILYGVLLIFAFFFDSSNNFIDMSLMSILTFGKWRVVDDSEIKKTVKKEGKTYVTRGGVFIRAGIIFLVGIMLVSGVILKCIALIINKLYG